MPASRRARKVAGPDGSFPRSPSSALRISSTSPMVMPATVPPLAAMMTATRNSTCFWACGVMPGSSSHARDSRAKPSGSRARIMFRASLRFLPPVSSHPSDGRMMSAPTRTSRELVISSSRDFESMPRSRSHPAGRSPHCPRASSAPEASHLSCQVCPGCSSSQSSSSGRPRRRLFWTRDSGRSEDAVPTRSITCPRPCRVAAQDCLCRAGGIALGQRRPGAAGGLGSGCVRRAVQDRGHRASLPNSTSIVSGR